MQTLTEKVFQLNPPGGLFDSTVVLNLFPDQTDGARKLLVNRALRQGEVIRLQAGLYCIAGSFRRSDPHPFFMASAIYGPSQVSLETALAFHGLIPEAVHQVSSVTVLRGRDFRTPLGRFTYRRVPSSAPRAGIKSVEVDRDQWAYVALPIRALVDLVYIRRVNWRTDGVDFLTGSLRMDEEELEHLDMAALDVILAGMRSRRVREFFNHLKEAFGSC